MIWKISLNLICMFFLSFSSMVCLISSLLMLFYNYTSVIEWDIMTLNSLCFVFVMIFDWISLMFLSFVLLISSMVLYYSGDYMMGDSNFNRFMYLVLAFVFSMGMMILSPNLISILLGWDGLGLVSYALVIFYQNEKSANAGMLTVLSNRVGDVAILLSIGLMSVLGGWNFFIYTFYLSDDYLLLKFLIVLAAMTKSARVPFPAWLPAAAVAPARVFGTGHSSSVIATGVYLMIRFSPALENSKSQIFLLIISCLTMFMSGLGANFEYDLKKIIALSTLSQLGVMLSVLSLGFPHLAFFHLLTHALFKALLFMCAGVIIHSVKEYQDIRCMGGLINFMPLTVMYMSVANLALCGSPFLAGFYSKDLILEMAFMGKLNLVVFVLYVLATSLTVCYTLRLIFYSLSGDFNLGVTSCVTDDSYTMTNSMMILGLGAVVSGSFLSWLIFPESYMICMSLFMKLLVLMISILGGVMGYMLNNMSVNNLLKSLSNYSFVVFMGSMWFMPFLSTFKSNLFGLSVGKMFFKLGDKGWYEYFGGQGFYNLVFYYAGLLQISNSNMIKVFMKSFMLGVVIIFFICI
uniref:NADH-ubiquinone oxidoreductase chain 5 n=1 Tax=Dynomene pilumnoides TaxID=1702342 RepID=A0A1B0RXN1_9EUCA|nr:NADH dehydrogenase subunit 5 [Dynomene pilumnoides]